VRRSAKTSHDSRKSGCILPISEIGGHLMSRRMMCTLCFETAEPETVLVGSDLAEIFGWLCFAIPGWLYCLWRHALRAKACMACGGDSLIREARTAQLEAAKRLAPPRIRSTSGSVRWPRAFASPRDRLLHGGISAALIGSAPIVSLLSAPVGLLGSWSVWFTVPGVTVAVGPGIVSWVVLCAGWLTFEFGRAIRMRTPSCSAWDAAGRELQIELA
jgi:hypothetical protein